MTGHAIKDGRPVCLEPETAHCRAMWDCDCELLHGLEQDPVTLRWAHAHYDEDGDERWHDQVDVAEPRHCNIVCWLDNSPLDDVWLSSWYSFGLYNTDADLPDGPITVDWDDECYVWEYADPRDLGRAIARGVVARWADDLGVAA